MEPDDITPAIAAIRGAIINCVLRPERIPPIERGRPSKKPQSTADFFATLATRFTGPKEAGT